MIIDSHLHVWRAQPEYPDPACTTVSPCSDVPVEVLEQYMAEHSVDRAVLVQPVYPGEDNSYVADCARAAPEQLAAVCVVDPRRPEAPETLEYWVTERGCRGLRLRPRVPEESACFGTPQTFPLWEKAGDLGIIVNLLMDSDQLPRVRPLAERFPQVPIVIDHMAHPDPAAGPDAPAFQELVALSSCPGVHVKLSGHYYASRTGYPYADCLPFARRLYDAFGPKRLLWGSDFPHVLLHAGYRRTLLLLERTCDFLTTRERNWILGENAGRLYWNDGPP